MLANEVILAPACSLKYTVPKSTVSAVMSQDSGMTCASNRILNNSKSFVGDVLFLTLILILISIPIIGR